MIKKRQPLSLRGAAVAGGSVALVIGGVVVVDGALMMLGLCGIILLISVWALGVLSLRKLEVSLHAPTRVKAGIAFPLEITLHNRHFLLDAFHTKIMLQLLGRDGKNDAGAAIEAVAPWTASGSAARIELPVTLRKRGAANIHSVWLTSTFPLRLFRLHRYLEVDREITVTPRCITPVELSCDGSMYDAVPRSGSATGHTFGEPRGIRPWQAGDSAKHIHWPASARSLAQGHALRVREYDPPGFHPDHCHIVFHSYATGGEMLREDRFERALSLLAGALSTLQRGGIPCVLAADFYHWAPVSCTTHAQLADCLYNLSSISRARGTEAHDLEACLRGVSSDHTLMIISDMAPESWAHLLTKHPQTLIVDIRQVRYRHQILHAASA